MTGEQLCAPGDNDWSCCTEAAPCGEGEGDCDKVSSYWLIVTILSCDWLIVTILSCDWCR